MRRCCSAAFGLVAFLQLPACPASAQSQPDAKDMALSGYNDLQARSAYQPTIHEQCGRWIAYIGHHGGTQEIPKPLNPLTGARNSTAPLSSMSPTRANPNTSRTSLATRAWRSRAARRWCACATARPAQGRPERGLHAAHVRQLSARDLEHGGPGEARSSSPRLDGLKGTHKSWWECDTGIAYLVSGEPVGACRA